MLIPRIIELNYGHITDLFLNLLYYNLLKVTVYFTFKVNFNIIMQVVL